MSLPRRVATPRNNEADCVRCDRVAPDESTEEGRNFTEPTKVANESDSSHIKEPETVATANAESTRRRISRSVLTPADSSGK